ncbi:DUF4177 domain-containing protein [Alkaliphilus oremlandii]|uniref:DUF4177 domain-containing protein n=1 Tax=Alkaliphilus oremlandii (strain OhILAs) TaxID=350688 RepID=A8MIA0_ALKOO|nr:DUF4177 domain-containing protein [Alkaliphilus oremlandii]ABW19532.1 conserved hypothetical protein [Alkaliphilus oremlandii OhILAs]
MYEYKFIEVPIKRNFSTKIGDSFKDCQEIILKEAADGWRLVQVVIPPNEKMGVLAAYKYQIIFERNKNRSNV